MKSRNGIVIDRCDLYFLPVRTRMPLKFGSETTTGVTCSRVMVEVEDGSGKRTAGWGETPLNVGWVWPSSVSHAEREAALLAFSTVIAREFPALDIRGHPMEIGHWFVSLKLPILLDTFNASRMDQEALPWLAALVCYSPFDLAVHDAFANGLSLPVYKTYTAEFMNRDLAWYFDREYSALFSGMYPDDFFTDPVPAALPAWHLVGGCDPLNPDHLTGEEPDDGYPVLLRDWIRRDGLRCLKIKLRGTDMDWDYSRLVEVGGIGKECGVEWLSADFNCTVRDPLYVTEILDKVRCDQPCLDAMLLYVEQPFPYDLYSNPIDVRSVSARKPLFMDESAHDWRCIAMGLDRGWTGVALKTCKTQTGALLSLCWAKAHGISLMVQDLTNPMLAQIPHLSLAAHAGTIMGVETNAMQFYPEASLLESVVHPDMYTRRHGMVGLASPGPTGFGYRTDEIHRVLPPKENASTKTGYFNYIIDFYR